MTDTIVALSSGQPPAAIAVVRVSGPSAFDAVTALTGSIPPPRRAALRALHDRDGQLLDRGLLLAFPGPASATGEDLVELHCHGGRAVVQAVIAALTADPRLRKAEPGEFTRRALLNGRLDLAQAEGLADLLAAETEAQRRAALAASEGRVSAAVRGWLDECARLSAMVEATLDYAEEGDVTREEALLASVIAGAAELRDTILATLAAPPVERVRDGLRVVLAGPPNSGKSTLLNLLCEREAAIVSVHAGTTRDRLEIPVARNGMAYLLTDTAGMREAVDPVERIGVARAGEAVQAADIVLWLGDGPPPRPDAVMVHARADLPGREQLPPGRDVAVQRNSEASIARLWDVIQSRGERLLPRMSELPLRAEQRAVCAAAAAELNLREDPLIAAEQLRRAAGSLAAILGLNATEMMLDALFSRFCLGK